MTAEAGDAYGDRTMEGRHGDVRKTKGRFAPSPTGRMHLGNVFAALMSWLSAKSRGGEWLLRIEDLDPQRSHAEYAEWLMDDLLWLGLEWDEGPGKDRGNGPYWQSRRGDIYEKALMELDAKGLVYPCTCTRSDIMATQAPHESDGRVVYRGTCRPQTDVPWQQVMASRPAAQCCLTGSPLQPRNCRRVLHEAAGAAALRLMVPPVELADVRCHDRHYGEVSVNLATHCGDFIVRRRDRAWAYQLAVVVDDALMGVTEVVRGRDLLLSAPQQMYVDRLLGFPSPAFAHIPLLVNAQGQRLSKRDKALDMGALRSRFTPGEILGRLAHAAGIIPHADSMSLPDLLSLFSWQKVPHGDIVCTV